MPTRRRPPAGAQPGGEEEIPDPAPLGGSHDFDDEEGDEEAPLDGAGEGGEDGDQGDLLTQLTDGAGHIKKDKHPYEGRIIALRAVLDTSLHDYYRGWKVRHESLVAGMTDEEAFAAYFLDVCRRDFEADWERAEEEKVYDMPWLHVEGLRPLLEAEARSILRRRLEPLRDRGVLSEADLLAIVEGK